MNQMPLNIDPSLMQVGKVNRGGMFGNADWGSALAAALAGFAAGGGNPAGGAALQMLNQRLAQKREQQQAQQQRQDSMADWQAKQQWQLDHAQPEQTAYARDLIAAGIMPGTPRFSQLYGQFVEQKAQTGGSLFGNLFKDPATGQQYMPANLPPLGQEMDDPRKQGGPTPQASGGFPPFGY